MKYSHSILRVLILLSSFPVPTSALVVDPSYPGGKVEAHDGHHGSSTSTEEKSRPLMLGSRAEQCRGTGASHSARLVARMQLDDIPPPEDWKSKARQVNPPLRAAPARLKPIRTGLSLPSESKGVQEAWRQGASPSKSLLGPNIPRFKINPGRPARLALLQSRPDIGSPNGSMSRSGLGPPSKSVPEREEGELPSPGPSTSSPSTSNPGSNLSHEKWPPSSLGPYRSLLGPTKPKFKPKPVRLASSPSRPDPGRPDGSSSQPGPTQTDSPRPGHQSSTSSSHESEPSYRKAPASSSSDLEEGEIVEHQPEKKEDWRNGIPLAENRRNIPNDKNRKSSMYQAIMPHPGESLGFQNAKTGGFSFYRKFGNLDTGRGIADPNLVMMNPSLQLKATHGQLKRYKDVKPARYQQRMSTGYGESKVKGGTNWFEIRPKTEEELRGGEKPWPPEKMADTLLEQAEHFKNHESGQRNSEWGKLESEIKKMCTMKQCNYTKQSMTRDKPEKGGQDG